MSTRHIPSFRPSGWRVAVYVRTGIPANNMVKIHSSLEAVCIKLHLAQRKNVYVVAVYRPPKGGASAADFMKCLQSSLDDILVSSKSTVCLVGNLMLRTPPGGMARVPQSLVFFWLVLQLLMPLLKWWTVLHVLLQRKPLLSWVNVRQ